MSIIRLRALTSPSARRTIRAASLTLSSLRTKAINRSSFGSVQQGAQTKRPRKGESAADKAKRASFKARHAKNIAKGKTSAAYWADKVKWS